MGFVLSIGREEVTEYAGFQVRLINVIWGEGIFNSLYKKSVVLEIGVAVSTSRLFSE